ncbi:MAG TPA: FAD-dependent oxidoreductase [Polyangiaceae bacterium]|nr:FAD-dependent oxidoreductase [Polyangiaceae bacterium]
MKLRASNLEKLEQRVFDVLVVGGGVNGAVSAAALASQGAKVALIDKGDFAGFTSQESSNLVWGGIKYLESFEFGLVRKLCLSRNRLLRAYPSSIREIRFFVTVAKGFRKSRFLLWLGLWLYWFIGNFFTKTPRLLTVRDIETEEPIVRTDGSQGGVEYSDAYLVDNDARFVFNFVRSAMNRGAIAANYVESLGARREGDLWVCSAVDTVGGRTMTIRARVLINACGPYVDDFNGKTGVTTEHKHVFSRGVHLVVDKLTPERRVLTFFADDGRLFFVIPLGPKSCIGTTDTREERLPPHVLPEDRRFVLDNVNKRLKLAKPLTEGSILAERCGVRPLVVKPDGGADKSADWTSLSRKHVIELDRAQSQLSIFGGKLTDCLNIGEEVCADVRALGVALPYAGHRWYGEPPDEVRDEFFHEARLMGLDELTSPESSEPLSTRLWRRYGESALRLLEDIRADPAMAEVLIAGAEYIRGELYHAARREMITKLEDFLRRRSKIALIARKETIERAPGLIEACRILFGEEAEQKFVEYFGAPPREEVVRASIRPAPMLQ